VLGLLVELQVQAAFLQLAEANVLRPYMRDAVAEVSQACLTLQANDAAPSSAGMHFCNRA
jgi:exocyst complex component 2